jgi:hypothetical protein
MKNSITALCDATLGAFSSPEFTVAQPCSTTTEKGSNSPGAFAGPGYAFGSKEVLELE